jgi:hypothetical protein
MASPGRSAPAWRVFTPAALLALLLAAPAHALRAVLGLSGRRLAVLTNREFTPGSHNLPWDGRGESGGLLGSGLDFVRLTTRGLPSQTVRLAVIR